MGAATPATGFSFVSRSSLNDPASGVSARWYFELRVDEEFSRALRNGTPITLISIEADATSVPTLARRLKAALRSYDLIGSLGGGRLAVAVMDSGPRERGALVARLQQAMDAAPEMSVACFPNDGITFETLLRRAEGRATSTLAGAA